MCSDARAEGDESVFPLSPLAILWLNMITGGFPSVGLGLEPAAIDVMQRPPHDIRQGVFTRHVIIDFFVVSYCHPGTVLCTLTRYLSTV